MGLNFNQCKILLLYTCRSYRKCNCWSFPWIDKMDRRVIKSFWFQNCPSFSFTIMGNFSVLEKLGCLMSLANNRMVPPAWIAFSHISKKFCSSTLSEQSTILLVFICVWPRNSETKKLFSKGPLTRTQDDTTRATHWETGRGWSFLHTQCFSSPPLASLQTITLLTPEGWWYFQLLAQASSHLVLLFYLPSPSLHSVHINSLSWERDDHHLLARV